jgi:predicted  nucleic acid-binding Zn-ribbon protein
MASSKKKVITDLQKEILAIRRETEEKQAEKAAVQEEISKLHFTLSLYQAEKGLDEDSLAKVETLKSRINQLESYIDSLPPQIRALESQHRKLRQAGRPG